MFCYYFVCVLNFFLMIILKPSCQLHFIFSFYFIFIINSNLSAYWLLNGFVNIVL